MKLFKYLAGAILVGLVASHSVSAQASIPTDASVKKFLQVTKTEEGFRQTFVESFLLAANMSILKNFQESHPQASSAQLNQAKIAIDKYTSSLANDIASDTKFRQTMIDELAKLIKKHYTQDEINAMIKFYDTPMGQRLATKQNSFSVSIAQHQEMFYLMETFTHNHMTSHQGETSLATLQSDLANIIK